MFDPVTDEALRRRRTAQLGEGPLEDVERRTSLVCSVCNREIRPEERVFWAAGEVHCSQCHGMLEFEYDQERRVDRDVRDMGTRWDRPGDGG